MFPIRAKEYLLTKPGAFEERNTTIESIPSGFTVISPRVTAICGSDLHYFRGEKSIEKLSKRLPLVLLHEGACYDHINKKRVVPVAGYSVQVPEMFRGRENVWPDLPYLGATNNGLARTHLLYPEELLITVPREISETRASLTEPFSIAIKAVKDMRVEPSDTVAIVGTGGLAYFLALALVHFVGISPRTLFIFGIHNEALASFSSLGKTVNYQEEPVSRYEKRFNAVFEAVGGKSFDETIKTSFELVLPGGKIGVMGISDHAVSIPANRLVNYGLMIHGLTRSTTQEYKEALGLMAKNEIGDRIEKDLVGDRQFTINSASALKNAFDFAAHSLKGRTILRWAE
jgi:ribitol-5-phosphate 2-dehydrogenase